MLPPKIFNPQGKSISIMGILNLSPDSFFEGSSAHNQAQALEMAEKLIAEGADILDVGAESSRPGSKPIPVELEIDRLLPFVTRICKQYNVPVSVDTYKPEVAKRVLEAGVKIINDITGLQKYPDMAKIIANYNAGVVLMHMQGTPETMQKRPRYQDLLGEVLSYLKKSIEIAEAAGIASDRLVIDPGIGFGKTSKHNLQLIGQLDRLKVLNKPILLGVSRKSFLGQILDLPTTERLEGSLAAAMIGLIRGASILRVHDVRATLRAVKVAQAILEDDHEME